MRVDDEWVGEGESWLCLFIVVIIVSVDVCASCTHASWQTNSPVLTPATPRPNAVKMVEEGAWEDLKKAMVGVVGQCQSLNWNEDVGTVEQSDDDDGDEPESFRRAPCEGPKSVHCSATCVGHLVKRHKLTSAHGPCMLRPSLTEPSSLRPRCESSTQE